MSLFLPGDCLAFVLIQGRALLLVDSYLSPVWPCEHSLHTRAFSSPLSVPSIQDMPSFLLPRTRARLFGRHGAFPYLSLSVPSSSLCSATIIYLYVLSLAFSIFISSSSIHSMKQGRQTEQTGQEEGQV